MRAKILPFVRDWRGVKGNASLRCERRSREDRCVGLFTDMLLLLNFAKRSSLSATVNRSLFSLRKELVGLVWLKDSSRKLDVDVTTSSPSFVERKDACGDVTMALPCLEVLGDAALGDLGVRVGECSEFGALDGGDLGVRVGDCGECGALDGRAVVGEDCGVEFSYTCLAKLIFCGSAAMSLIFAPSRRVLGEFGAW